MESLLTGWMTGCTFCFYSHFTLRLCTLCSSSKHPKYSMQQRESNKMKTNGSVWQSGWETSQAQRILNMTRQTKLMLLCAQHKVCVLWVMFFPSTSLWSSALIAFIMYVHESFAKKKLIKFSLVSCIFARFLRFSFRFRLFETRFNLFERYKCSHQW